MENPNTAYQKFQKGDLVRIADDLGPGMSHFTSGVEAIVIGSFADKYGGRNRRDYTLYLRGGGECSWYKEHQLELIERGRLDLLEDWKREKTEEVKQKSDLDWIFANGGLVLEEAHGSSVAALAKCFGCHNLWGSRGEGVTYYQNSLCVLRMADGYLRAGDKEGWLKRSEEIRDALERSKRSS